MNLPCSLHVAEGFTDRNQLAALTLHGLILPQDPDSDGRSVAG